MCVSVCESERRGERDRTYRVWTLVRDHACGVWVCVVGGEDVMGSSEGICVRNGWGIGARERLVLGAAARGWQ